MSVKKFMIQAPGQIVLLGEILGVCTIKHYKFAIYGEMTRFVVS
jgi:hypothetical protein